MPLVEPESTPEAYRMQILGKVQRAIRKHGFTAKELATPSESDLALVLLAADDFPIKLPHTKLAILCLTGSRGTVYRKDIIQLVGKDYSTIAHNLIELRQYGLLCEEVEETGKARTRLRKYTLTQTGREVFLRFLENYQRKVVDGMRLFVSTTGGGAVAAVSG